MFSNHEVQCSQNIQYKVSLEILECTLLYKLTMPVSVSMHKMLSINNTFLKTRYNFSSECSLMNPEIIGTL